MSTVGIILIIVDVLSIALSVKALYSGIKYHKKLEVYRYVYFISMITALILAILWLIISILYFAEIEVQGYAILSIVMSSLQFIFYFVFQLYVYLRLDYSFAGTIFVLSKTNNIIFRLLLGMYLVIMISFQLVLYLEIPKYILGIISLILYVVYCFNSIFMMIVFILKLNKLIQNATKKQHELIHLCVKCIITSSIAFILTILFNGIAYIQLMINSRYDITIPTILFRIDTVFHIILLYLQFSFAENTYYKLCGLCHMCVLRCMKYKKSTDNSVDPTPSEQRSCNDKSDINILPSTTLANLSQIKLEVGLDGINSEGKIITKYGKKIPKHFTMEEITTLMNVNVDAINNYEGSMHIKLMNNDMDITQYVKTDTDRSAITTNKSLIIYEFDNVITTSIKPNSKKVKIDKAILLFGGKDRILSLKCHLNNMRRKSDNVILLCLSQLSTKCVRYLLSQCELMEYFICYKDGVRVSNVIGKDAKIYKNVELINIKIYMYE